MIPTTNRNSRLGIVKQDFDFGWKAGGRLHEGDALALKHQKGDVLDVGCGTCQLYRHLRQSGWIGKYTGVDVQRYDGYSYPKGVELMIGDASYLPFPQTDTVVMYNLLEHVDDPCALLSKAVESCRENVLVNVPKRNERLWEHGVVEYHQLDKTHRHCGFSKEEMNTIIDMSGGKIRRHQGIGWIDATAGVRMWKNRIPREIVSFLGKVFPSEVYFSEMWYEVIKSDRKA